MIKSVATVIVSICIFSSSAVDLLAKTIHDETYRFNICVQDSSVVHYGDKSAQPYLTAYSQDCLVMIDVSTLDGDRVYSYRNTILGSPLFKKNSFLYLQTIEPWYNLLRNSRIVIEQPVDGMVLCHRVVFRAQTLFWIRVACEQNRLEEAKSIIESFDANCNTKSYYRIMRSNLRWYQGSFYLTIIPFLGYLSSNNRRKWKKSGKLDRIALGLYVLYGTLSLLLICLAMFCVKGCQVLAITIGVCSVLVWMAFFFGRRFLINFIEGLF